MKTIDQIYLERLAKNLQSLLKRLNMEKPGSAFGKAEIRALSGFTMEAPKGLLPFVQSLHNQLWLIEHLPEAKRNASIYFLQMELSSALRLLAVLKITGIKKLKAVQRELRANNVMEMKRKDYSLTKDVVFEKMILRFLRTAGKINDHIYKNIAILPTLYLEPLDYYLEHKKEISGSRQWYDFLTISNYILCGVKLELLLVQRIKKR